MAATKGVVPARATSTTAWATRSDGGLDTRRMASVPGSSRRAATASLAMRPSTASFRSRPPRPMTWVTVAPHRSSRLIASWAPVPAAATTPTRGRPSSSPAGCTALANPSPVPPSMAVPAPGPITSRPRAVARSLSSTSSATDTLSLKSRTWSPAVNALCASRAA